MERHDGLLAWPVCTYCDPVPVPGSRLGCARQHVSSRGNLCAPWVLHFLTMAESCRWPTASLMTQGACVQYPSVPNYSLRYWRVGHVRWQGVAGRAAVWA